MTPPNPITVAPLPDQVRGSVTVSVDLEDWHQIVTRRWSGVLPGCSDHVDGQTKRVLDLFDQRGIRATFFVLGLVAREKPALVREVAARGHEIASHGVMHLTLDQLDRSAVATDLVDSRKMLSDIIGDDVVGYRAPEFSVTKKNIWVLEELAAAGYRYDSSIFPIKNPRYGIPDFPRVPSKVMLESGRSIYELPIGTYPTSFYGNVPIGGGGYFRLFPGAVLDKAIQRLGQRGEHTMLYCHPYEFTRSRLVLDDDALPTDPKTRARAKLWLAKQAIGRGRLPKRLERILRHIRPQRAIDLVRAFDAASAAPARRATTSRETQETT